MYFIVSRLQGRIHLLSNSQLKTKGFKDKTFILSCLLLAIRKLGLNRVNYFI